MTHAIEVSHLSKTFVSESQSHQRVRALDDLSVEIQRGEIVCILGPNGAGKTTFLNILSTLLLADAGEVKILGIPLIPRNFDRLRRVLNMSSGYPNFPWSLTVKENLEFYGRLYGLTGKTLETKVAELTDLFLLTDYSGRRFDELSSGTKQRLSLAKSLLNNPQIIFLDEPTVGLDPDAAAQTRAVIQNVLKNSRVTVLLTTHNMSEAEQMCQRIAFIKQGRIIQLATPGELKQSRGKKDLEEVFLDLAHEKGAIAPARTPLRAVSEKSATALVSDISVGDQVRGWKNRVWAFAMRNYLFAVRNVFAFAELVFWPMVSLVSIGLLGDFLQLQERALAFVLTGAITGGVLQVAQLDVAYSLLYEVWSKSMKQTFLTPVGVSEQLVGSWLIGMARGLTIFVILALAAVFMFHFEFPSLVVTAVYLVGIFCCAFLVGLLVSILILTFGQKAEITAWMFAYLFMLVCGIYYPIDTLPPFFAWCARFIPLTYFLEYFRGGFGFPPQTSFVLLKGFGLVAVYFIFGLVMMQRAFYNARRKGTIVRLSE